MKESKIPEWVPKCKKCGTQMIDATALMMGQRFRCPYECSVILEHDWDEKEKRIAKGTKSVKKG